MKTIPFTKMSAAGNDFILIDNRAAVVDAARGSELARSICRRKLSVGADGLILIEDSPRADFKWRFFNADGSEAEMCGNGIRCVAKHLYDFAIAPMEHMRINTLGGMKEVTVTISEGEVTEVSVDMGAPMLDCRDVPMDCEGRFVDGTIEVNGMKIKGTAVSMGNPHFVIFQKMADMEVQELGPVVHAHPMFPKKTNVEFVQSRENRLDVTVYERGAGWTQACGTGACATAVAAGLQGIVPLGKNVIVRLPGGDLTINVKKDLSMVRMTGPAVRVFQGEMEL